MIVTVGTGSQVGSDEVAQLTLGAASASGPPVDVIFSTPHGDTVRVPAFTSKGAWHVRYGSRIPGTHSFLVAAGDDPLDRATGAIDVVEKPSRDSLASRGAIRASKDGRRFRHDDGTPFLWVADTWWMGFTNRISAEEFDALAAKRRDQGYTAIQIVAGLYPEMAPFEPAGSSDSGWPWHEGFTDINPAWFDEADERVLSLVGHDLVPCIVGAWAYYLQFMTPPQLLRHWRELIARWGALPVAWCLAGEPGMPWYPNKPKRPTKESRVRRGLDELVEEMVALPEAIAQVAGVNEVGRGLRALEPFGRPIGLHTIPSKQPWEYLEDESLVDFWLLQTGHAGPWSLQPSVRAVQDALRHEPTKPVVNGEVCYEAAAGSSWQDIQRFLYWSHLLSGAAGHTYGAFGVWAFNTPELPGLYSGLCPMWKDAVEFAGAEQVGLGAKLLSALPWDRFETHSEWVDPHEDSEDSLLPFAAGLPGGVRIVYFPSWATVLSPVSLAVPRLCELGSGSWRARIINPSTCEVEQDFEVTPDADGSYLLERGYRGVTALPSRDDWLVVLEPA